MHVITERQYIFRRKPVRGRVAVAILASLVALGAANLNIAEAKPGGYQRMNSSEEPPK
jgi:hypothetical protein